MAFTVALLGAESTGKTTLAKALVGHFCNEDIPSLLVPEYLRTWCQDQGRTPLAHEQIAIAATQTHHIAQALDAAPSDAFVIVDTSPLMTAVYSAVYFNDHHLYPEALHTQRGFDLTLLLGLDLPWVADGLQRDSDAMRHRVDTCLREVLRTQGLAYATVYGLGPDRLASALQAIAQPSRSSTKHETRKAWSWSCEKCSDAACEHQLFRRWVP